LTAVEAPPDRIAQEAVVMKREGRLPEQHIRRRAGAPIAPCPIGPLALPRADAAARLLRIGVPSPAQVGNVVANSKTSDNDATVPAG
jgi:hypothetical protein